MSEITQNSTANAQSDHLDRFLNYSFHELRTPLTIIYSCAQLAADKLPADADFERLRRLMRQMLNQSEELVAMLDEFLEASRLQANKLELDRTEVEMRELCQQTLAHLNSTQQARVELKFPTDAGQLVVQADGTRLETAIFILVDLGLKLAPPTSNIKLVLDNHIQATFVVKVIIAGLEITEAEQASMFSPSFVPDNTYTRLKAGRSGVGLYIAQGIIQTHGGSLEYVADLPGFEIKLGS